MSTAAAVVVTAGRYRRLPPWLTRPPASTSVGGGGSGNRGNPGRACHNPCGALPNCPQGQDGPHAGEALGTGDPLLPGAANVGGGPGPWPGAGDGGRSQPGRKGVSHAIAIIRLGQRLLDPATSILLLGKSACRGPLSGGGDP